MHAQGLPCTAHLALPLSLPHLIVPRRVHLNRRHLQVVAQARGSPVSEADLYIGIDAGTAAPPPSSGLPWYIAAPAGFIAILAVFRTIGAISRRRYLVSSFKIEGLYAINIIICIPFIMG